jgi:hypothetical protein
MFIANVFDAAWELNAFSNEDIERWGNGSTEGQSDSSTSS